MKILSVGACNKIQVMTGGPGTVLTAYTSKPARYYNKPAAHAAILQEDFNL
jgi:hypothetical protein